MRLSQIVNDAIRFNQTKSGKIRIVPISLDLEKELKEHYKKHGKTEILFEPSYNTFCNTVTHTSFMLPVSQATHVLRHTYARSFKRSARFKPDFNDKKMTRFFIISVRPQQGGADASLIGAIMAIILWGAAVLVALLLDFIFGEE